MAEDRDTERDLSPPESHSGNTLLSVGPAQDDKEPRDVRADELERRLEQLEARLKVLELARAHAPNSERPWLFWVVVLLALALGWQLRAFLP